MKTTRRTVRGLRAEVDRREANHRQHAAPLGRHVDGGSACTNIHQVGTGAGRDTGLALELPCYRHMIGLLFGKVRSSYA